MKLLLFVLALFGSIVVSSAQQVAIWGTDFGTNLATSATTSSTTYRQRIPVAVDTNGYLYVQSPVASTFKVGAMDFVSTNLVVLTNDVATTNGNVWFRITNSTIFASAGAGALVSSITWIAASNTPVELYFTSTNAPATTNNQALSFTPLAVGQYLYGPPVGLTNYTDADGYYLLSERNVNLPLIDKAGNGQLVIIGRARGVADGFSGVRTNAMLIISGSLDK